MCVCVCLSLSVLCHVVVGMDLEVWSIIVNWLPWEFVVMEKECVSNVCAI